MVFGFNEKQEKVEMKDAFIIEQKTLTSRTVNADADSGELFDDITKSGYKALAIAGTECNVTDTFTLNTFEIMNGESTDYIKYEIHNGSTSSYTFSIKVNVLYVKK